MGCWWLHDLRRLRSWITQFGLASAGYTFPSYHRYTCLGLVLTIGNILANSINLLEELGDSYAHWTMHEAGLTKSRLGLA
jgi:hypothetical protein